MQAISCCFADTLGDGGTHATTYTDLNSAGITDGNHYDFASCNRDDHRFGDDVRVTQRILIRTTTS